MQLTLSEVPFTLPVGLIDEQGRLHREGVMRRATAFDELDVQLDPRTREHEGWIPLLLLSRVVTRLGTLPCVEPMTIGRLFATDYSYLQSLYVRLNADATADLVVDCPECAARLSFRGLA